MRASAASGAKAPVSPKLATPPTTLLLTKPERNTGFWFTASYLNTESTVGLTRFAAARASSNFPFIKLKRAIMAWMALGKLMSVPTLVLNVAEGTLALMIPSACFKMAIASSRAAARGLKFGRLPSM